MNENKKYVELIWYQKYDKLELGQKMPIEKPNLPFQVVETVNKPRLKDLEEGLFDTSKYYPENEYPSNYPKDWKNLLIWGDNKLVMSSLIKQGWAGKINLIYIDPPFFTGADFTVRTKLGDEEIEKEPSIIEERAYKDTWSGGIASYLKYMYERLVLMRDLLAENGSIYVHLDWHVGHYVKVMMDEIFGYENFRNEIVWKRHVMVSSVEGGLSSYGHKTDTILFYTKSKGNTFNIQYQTIDEELLKSKFSCVEKETGRRFETQPLILDGDEPRKLDFPTKTLELPKGKRFAWNQNTLDEKLRKNPYVIYWTQNGIPRQKKYLDEFRGQPCSNLWDDLLPITSNSNESLGYFTQKPEALLKRIILASSNEGDIVADFFCGSGTTLAVAEKLGRRWIGSDLSKFAIQVTRKRLLDIHNSNDLIED